MSKINHNETSFKKGKLRITVNLFFVMYIVYLVYLTLFSTYYGRDYFHRSLNLIPFRTLAEYLHSTYNFSIILTNLVGNIAAFIPMGLLLPVVLKRIDRFKRVIFIILISTVAIEITQYILGVGTTDIDDVILNTLGGMLGFCLYSFLKRKNSIL